MSGSNISVLVLIHVHLLGSIKRHLKPLAIAANISQANHIRPDQILLILGLLYLQFSEFKETDERSMRATMLSAIESRWLKVDQDVFVAALILNPFHKISAFQPLHFLTTGGVYGLMRRLWVRFYGTEPTTDLWRNVRDYLENTGEYATMKSYIGPIRADAESRVRLCSLRFLCHGTQSCPLECEP